MKYPKQQLNELLRRKAFEPYLNVEMISVKDLLSVFKPADIRAGDAGDGAHHLDVASLVNSAVLHLDGEVGSGLQVVLDRGSVLQSRFVKRRATEATGKVHF